MPLISILSTPYCNGKMIAQELARERGLSFIDDEIINKVSVENDIHIDKLIEAINGTNSFFQMSVKDRRRYIFMIKDAIAREVAGNDCVVVGFTSHLIPRDISHVLKVCLTADLDYRIDNVMKKRNINQKEATDLLKNLDKNMYNWTDFVYKTNPFDVNLYDLVIPVHKKNIDEIIATISVNMAKDVLEESSESRKKMLDFFLSSKVNAILANKGHDVDVVADNGKVSVLLRRYYFRLEHYKKELRNIVKDIDGVFSVEIKIGPSFNMPPSNIPIDFEVPRKILLVDDEREYVEILSERLKSRNIVSAIAYDGHEALDVMKLEKPEVVVLDLKMPGMTGMEVLRKIKEDYPDIEVIILTGHGSQLDKELALDIGAFAFLEKPVDIKILSETMKQAYNKISR